MKLMIIHDASGKILGMGEVHADPEQRRVGVVPLVGQTVIEVEKTGYLASMKVSEILQSHHVHVAEKRLIRR